MNLLALVLAGHFLGDWVVQSDWQAQNKMRSWRAMGQHMIGYHLVLALLSGFAWPFHRGLPIRWWVFIGVSLVTHAVIDRRRPVQWLLRHTGSAAFAEQPWGVMAVDQALHLSILCILVALLP